MKKRLFLNLPALSKLLLICLFTSVFSNSRAQGGEPKVTVTLKILKIGYNDVDKKKKARPVWKFYSPTGMPLTNAKAGDCYEFKSKRKNDDDDVKEEESELRPFNASLPSFGIMMECYASTKGGTVCTYDAKDQEHSKITYTLDPVMNKVLTGDWSGDFKIVDNNGAFYAFCKYKYTLIELGKITATLKDSINAVDHLIELKVSPLIPNKENMPFHWEYSLDTISWTKIENSNTDKSVFKFNPLKDIFKEKFDVTKKIYFHASLDNNGLTLNSNALSLSFTPAAPISTDTLTRYSCHGATNGRILIRNIKSATAKINYVLRKGDAGKILCDLRDTSFSSCPGFLKKGYARGSNIDLNDLPAGTYNLIIYNGEMEVGNVYTSFNFNIDELPELKIRPNSRPHQPTCINEQGGGISLKVDGGKNLWQIILSPKMGKLTWHGGDDISIDDLPGGTYLLELTDKCGNYQYKQFSLRKPKRLAIDSIVLHNKPLELQVIIKPGSGTSSYKVTVTDPRQIEKPYDNITEINIPIQDEGLYRIRIMDNGNSNCPSLDTTVTIKKTGTAKFPKYQIGEKDGTGIYYRKGLHLSKKTTEYCIASFGSRRSLDRMGNSFTVSFFA